MSKNMPAVLKVYLATIGARGGRAGSVEAKRRAGKAGAAARWGAIAANLAAARALRAAAAPSPNGKPESQ